MVIATPRGNPFTPIDIAMQRRQSRAPALTTRTRAQRATPLVALLLVAFALVSCAHAPAAPSRLAEPAIARASAPPVLETGGQHPMPNEWIDRGTGHRVRKLVQR